MSVETLISIGASIVLAALSPWLQSWWQSRNSARNRAGPINRVAYELAYRGMLQNLAGRHINSKTQMRNGKAWLKHAAYLHKSSSRIGWNDAIDDIKEAIIASAIKAGPDLCCDNDFLQKQILARLESRIGSRPISQFQHTWSDAIQTADFYQGTIRTQMRRQKMIGNVAQFLGAIALFAAAVFLLGSAPTVWNALDRLPHDILAPERHLQLKIVYGVVVAGFLGGGFGLLFAER